MSDESGAAELRDGLTVVDAAAAEVAASDEHLQKVTQEARQRLEAAVTVLGEAVRSLARDHDLEPAQRDALARRVYWRHERVQVREIVDAFGYRSQSELLAVVGEVNSGVPCEHCGTPLRATSHSRMAEIQAAAVGRRRSYGKNLSCDDCLAAQRAARNAENAEYWSRIHALREAAVSAPALEWEAATTLILGYPPLLSHDQYAWHVHDMAHEIQRVALGQPQDADVEVVFRVAEQVAEAVAEITTWDELAATRTVQAVGYSATAGALARRLAVAVDATRSAIGSPR